MTTLPAYAGISGSIQPYSAPGCNCAVRLAPARAPLSAKLLQRDAADLRGIAEAGLADRDDPCRDDPGHEVIAIEQAKRVQEVLKSLIENFDLIRLEIVVPQKSIDRHPVHLIQEPPAAAILEPICDRNLNVN